MSDSISVVTAPAVTSSVKFVNADDTTATIQWSAVSNATSYIVKYNNQEYACSTTSYKIPMVSGVSIAYVYSCKTSSSGYTAVSSSYSCIAGLKTLTMKVTRGNFGLSSLYSRSGLVAAINYSGDGYEVRGYNSKGKKVFSGSSTSIYASVTIKYNKMYKYRVRAYVDTDAGRIYGNWSAYRYIVNPKSVTVSSSNKKIKLSWSKLSNVAKIKIQISTKKDSGYKTAATIKGTKTSYTISKYGKKALTKGKTYYVRIYYYAKGTKSKYQSDMGNLGSITVR